MFKSEIKNGQLTITETKSTRKAFYKGEFVAKKNLRTGEVTGSATLSTLPHLTSRIADIFGETPTTGAMPGEGIPA